MEKDFIRFTSLEFLEHHKKSVDVDERGLCWNNKQSNFNSLINFQTHKTLSDQKSRTAVDFTM